MSVVVLEILVVLVFLALFDLSDANFKNFKLSPSVALPARPVVGAIWVCISGNGFGFAIAFCHQPGGAGHADDRKWDTVQR